MNSFLHYIIENIWGACLKAVISAMLLQAICLGCFIEPEYLSLTSVLAVSLCVQLFLMLPARNRNGRRFSLAGIAVACVIIVLLIRQNGDPSGILLYGLIAIILNTLVFLLGKSCAGTAVIFLTAGIILCAAAFLRYSEGVPQTLAGLSASACLYLWQDYSAKAKRAGTKRRGLRFGGVSACLCVGICAVACLLHVFIIKPLAPPTIELKLTSRLMSLEILERIGVASQIYLDDPNKTSDETERSNDISGEKGDENSDAAEQEKPDDSASAQMEENKFGQGYAGSGKQWRDFTAIRYDRGRLIVIAVIVLLLLAPFAAVIIKRRSRRAWYRRLCAQGAKDQICALYCFFNKSFRRFGLGILPSETPREYAGRMSVRLGGFVGGNDQFERLGEIYTRCRYGNIEPAEAESACFRAAYERFYGNCRLQLGRFRYAINYFFI